MTGRVLKCPLTNALPDLRRGLGLLLLHPHSSVDQAIGTDKFVVHRGHFFIIEVPTGLLPLRPREQSTRAARPVLAVGRGGMYAN